MAGKKGWERDTSGLIPFKAAGDESLSEFIGLKVYPSMFKKLDSMGKAKNDFIRQAIQEKLDREAQD